MPRRKLGVSPFDAFYGRALAACAASWLAAAAVWHVTSGVGAVASLDAATSVAAAIAWLVALPLAGALAPGERVAAQRLQVALPPPLQLTGPAAARRRPVASAAERPLSSPARHAGTCAAACDDQPTPPDALGHAQRTTARAPFRLAQGRDDVARSSGWQRPAAAVVVVLGALAGLVCAMIWPVTALLLGAVLLTCAIALRAPVAGFLLALLVVGCEGLLKARLVTEDVPSGLEVGALAIDLTLAVASASLLWRDRGAALRATWRAGGRAEHAFGACWRPGSRSRWSRSPSARASSTRSRGSGRRRPTPSWSSRASRSSPSPGDGTGCAGCSGSSRPSPRTPPSGWPSTRRRG